MKLLAVVTPPSIYHGCSIQKTFWEEKLTGKEDFFLSVNMKNCGRRKVRKHKEIKGNDKYITLDIPSKFDSLDKMKTTSSESKGKLEWSGNGLVTSLGFKTKVRFAKIQKGKVCHRKCQWEVLESTNTAPSNLKYNISMKCTVFTYHLDSMSSHWF